MKRPLKKPKKNSGSDVVALRPANNSEASGLRGMMKVESNEDSSKKHFSSTKEIALMDEGNELDNEQLSDLKIIYSDMSDNKIANTFRDLRTKLIQKSQGKNFIAMITSCIPGSDSSSIAINLATAFSFDESKTSLLIDCNLNEPKIDKMLGITVDKGLTDYLEDDSIDVTKIIHKTGIKRLRMLPAGSSRETATEYFTSIRMRELMTDLLNRYSDRYIFLDAAPIADSADSRILAELCDFIILVVPYGVATKNRIQASADAIGPDKLLGVIFNDIPKVPSFRVPGVGRSKA